MEDKNVLNFINKIKIIVLDLIIEEEKFWLPQKYF